MSALDYRAFSAMDANMSSPGPIRMWDCPWCHRTNYRRNAGKDKCGHCAAIVLTEPNGDFQLNVRHTIKA